MHNSKNNRKIISTFTILLWLVTFFNLVSPISLHAVSFEPFVKKYNNVQISRQGLEKIKNYDKYINHFSDIAFFKPRHKVHPDFIRALILAESQADPQAISNKDARGLGQILPETGRIAGRELYNTGNDFTYVTRSKLKNIKASDLHDPAINILLTCYLISKYNYEYDGQLQLVVSAWNAGQNAITDNQPPNYNETLDLIGKINGYFKYLLAQNKQPETRQDDHLGQLSQR